MVRKTIDILALILVIIAISAFIIRYFFIKDQFDKSDIVIEGSFGPEGELIIKDSPSTSSPEIDSSLPFKSHETLNYNIFYKKMKIGKSTLTFNGKKLVNGKELLHFTFYTNTLYLKDREEIYAQKDSLLPVQIKRTIHKPGLPKSEITENYDQKRGKLTITKKGILGTKTTNINKDKPIQNAILLNYVLRTKQMQPGEEILINLPTLEMTVKFTGLKDVKLDDKTEKVYVFESVPDDKLIVWLENNESKTPIKIYNPGIFGYTMILDKDNAS